MVAGEKSLLHVPHGKAYPAHELVEGLQEKGRGEEVPVELLRALGSLDLELLLSRVPEHARNHDGQASS
jgi:hypothetical protein